MHGVIAVDKTLSTLIEVLEVEGYDIVLLDNNSMDSVDAIIVGSIESSLLYMHDGEIDVPIIHGMDKTYNDIIQELELM